jgi:hypothetical protein
MFSSNAAKNSDAYSWQLWAASSYFPSSKYGHIPIDQWPFSGRLCFDHLSNEHHHRRQEVHMGFRTVVSA